MGRRLGDRGGGVTVRLIELQSDNAARELRRIVTGSDSGRYTKAQASAAVTALLEQHAAGRLLVVSDDMIDALALLPRGQHPGVDQLISALEVAGRGVFPTMATVPEIELNKVLAIRGPEEEVAADLVQVAKSYGIAPKSLRSSTPWELIDEIQDRLSEIAPEGYVFGLRGRKEFGFWPREG